MTELPYPGQTQWGAQLNAAITDGLDARVTAAQLQAATDGLVTAAQLQAATDGLVPREDYPGITVDTSVGTRVMVGDTTIFYNSGWRDMSDYITPGALHLDVNAARCVMRRNLNTVDLLVRARIGLAGWRTARRPIMEGLPATFRQAPAVSGVLGTSAVLGGAQFTISNGGAPSRLDIQGYEGQWDGETVTFYLSYPSPPSIPTSLPGIPA